jgi:acyl-coenzyme A thioesterase 13
LLSIELVVQLLYVLTSSGFGTRTGKLLKLVDVSVLPKLDEPQRQEARVVLEMTVSEGL